MSKVKTANELLMMFIKDLYKSQTGKPSKATAIAAMNFVGSHEKLQQDVNHGDWKAVSNYNLDK